MVKRLKRSEAKVKKLEEDRRNKKEGNHMKLLEEAVHKFISEEKRELLWNEILCSTSLKPTYNDNIKDFAITLHYYSPKAYEFVREKIKLPHIATLRKWMAQYNCDPGFLQGPFSYLQNAVKKEKNSYLKNVGIIIDAMAIRSQVIYDESRDKICGKVHYGGILNEDKDSLAKEALVIQIVSYCQKFKLVIAYFLINGISAQIQSIFLLEAIKRLYNIGIIVRSITCDGTDANFATMRTLGCDFTFDGDNMKTYFFHPCQQDIKIYFIADSAHMIKLCRNTFMEKSNITSPSGKISNTFVRKLHAVQENIDLKLANKLSNEHMFYFKRKMNVRLAVQTISSGVTDAINYLNSQNNSDFSGSAATVEFLQIFNHLFDIMNTRNSRGMHFKSPLRSNNLLYFKEVFSSYRQYIRNLKIEDIDILQHRRKTFALGFIIDTFSFYNLAVDLFTNNLQTYFLTYKCSQDHLELTFSCIRQRGGWNNNPNCLQLKWSLRQLLFRNSVKPSSNANCSTDEYYESIPVLESRKHEESMINSDTIVESSNENESHLEHLSDLMNSDNISSLQQNILYYITGCIVRTLLLKIKCEYCHKFLLKDTYNDIEHCYAKDDKELNKYSTFSTFVNRGKLCFPSDIAYKIILTGEKAFLNEIHCGNINMSFLKRNIIAIVLDKLYCTVLFESTHSVLDNTGAEDLHEIQLLKALVLSYCKCRIRSYTKKSTENFVGNRINSRQQLTKTVLFYNI